MEKNSSVNNEEKPVRKGRGGYRPGSGRKKGSTERITIDGLLETLKTQAKGRKYEDLLVEDFLKARTNGDSQLTIKYHNLILNKVMSTLNTVEVADSADSVEMKQQAFAEALAKLTGLQKD